MGLAASDAFRMMMVTIIKEKTPPFEPLVPNKETIEAMKAARRGELVTVGRSGHSGCLTGPSRTGAPDLVLAVSAGNLQP